MEANGNSILFYDVELVLDVKVNYPIYVPCSDFFKKIRHFPPAIHFLGPVCIFIFFHRSLL